MQVSYALKRFSPSTQSSRHPGNRGTLVDIPSLEAMVAESHLSQASKVSTLGPALKTLATPGSCEVPHSPIPGSPGTFPLHFASSAFVLSSNKAELFLLCFLETSGFDRSPLY